MDKEEKMARLRAEAEGLLTRVCDPGVNIVWGEGNLDSPIAIFGEAPGKQEDLLKRPFVGRAGRFLEVELESAGIPRAGAYISNVVKCRPKKVKNGRPTNRPPTLSELRAWSGLLAREIEVISPKLILCLGAVAASVLIHPRFVMNSERGRWFLSAYGPRAMATFHPSYVQRSATHVLWLFREDLRAAAGAL